MQPLILIRHAEARHHVEAITGGWTDTELTTRGFRQADLLAERLRRELGGGCFHLGVSSLTRARQTAGAIAACLGLEPVVYPELVDLNNGVAANKTHLEARSLALQPTEPIEDWYPYPQAESWRQFYFRTTRFLENFTACQPSPALLVTHAANIHVIVNWWLGLLVDSRTHFGIAPASLTVLTTSRWGERSIERLNDTAHLYLGGMPDKIRVNL